ncbi:TetR/AcrR family transcriptional regulator [Streptomyces griseorubiginosus]|uniref:TetR/AcrR family transcriptional regulator n=1 Tax=Streptomyces griseorubiginosus TaxID=67304 RepID=UPI0036433F5D
MDTTPCSATRILDAAEQLFGSRGYANVTISQICELSRLPVGSVYHHFGSKSGVLRAVLWRGMTAFFEGLPAVDDVPAPTRERLAAQYEIAADLVAEHVPLFRLFASLQLHPSDDGEVRAIVREDKERRHRWLGSVLEQVALSSGIPDAHVFADELAALNLVFVTGLVAHAEAVPDIRTAISSHLYRLVLTSITDRARSASMGS